MPENFYTVSELNRFIKDVLNAGFPRPVWVCGEVQGYNRQKDKNHVFFQLIEKDDSGQSARAAIDLVIWAGNKPRISQILARAENDFELKDDIEVKFLCSVDFYPPHGRVRLAVESIDPVYTLGKLAQDRQRLIARLKAEGVFEKNKAAELSVVPLRVGLVTSDNSAAYNDFINELQSSGIGFLVFLRDALMQGRAAGADIARAVAELNRIPGLDAVVITRGGGSVTDLSCFDSEDVARAVAGSVVPVLSGIGHQIDLSIADLSAWQYFKTPTAVAQFLAARVREFTRGLDRAWERVDGSARDYLEEEKNRLRRDAGVLQGSTQRFFQDHREGLISFVQAFKHQPRLIVERQRQRIKNAQDALARRPRQVLEENRARLKGYARLVEVSRPANVLRRGFSITRDAKGRLVKEAAAARPSTVLETELAEGSVRSVVVDPKQGELF
jgi:exodeoxyribonuclease VII large subunit